MLRRAGKFLLILAIGLLVLCAGALTAVTFSESGSRWLIRQALIYTPGELEIRDIRGRLASGLTLTGVQYRFKQATLDIDQLTIGWRAADLLAGNVRIRQLDVRNVHYRAPVTAADAEPFVWPEQIFLPLSIQIDRARAVGLRVEVGDHLTLIDELTLSAHAGPLDGLRIEQLHLSRQASTLQLNGRAELHQPYRFHCKLGWATRLPDAVRATGEAMLDGNRHRFDIQHTLSRPFRVTSKGSIQLDGEQPVFQLGGQWQALRWPLSGVAQYASSHGKFEVKGNLDAYRLDLNGPLDAQNIPHAQVQAKVHGDAGSLVVDRLHIDALDGRLSATGELAWAPAFKLGLDIEASAIDPGQEWPEWPGRLGLTARLDMAGEEEHIRASFRGLKVKGTLREHPVAARGELSFYDGVPESTGLTIQSGKNRIDVSGILDAQTGLRYRIDAPQLSRVLPKLTGHVRADGVIKGPLETISGHADLAATGLSYQGDSVRALSAQAWFDPAKAQTSKVRVKAQDVRVGKTRAESVVLTGQGRIDAHQARLETTAGQRHALVELRGGYRKNAWDGVLELATLDLHDLGNWKLRDSVPLHVTTHSVRPFQACWQAQQRQVCLQGREGNDVLQLTITGKSAEGHLDSSIRVNQFRTGNPTLSGNVKLDIPDVRFLAPLLTDVEIAGGTAVAEIRLAGHLNAPKINGTASLSKGLVVIPALDVEMKNIGLQAEGGGSSVVLKGSADSGKGNLSLDGTVSLQPEDAWPFTVKLQGKRFAISGLPDRVILVDPELKVAGSLRRVDITGTVLVPYARIKLKKLPPSVVKVSTDQVLVGPMAPPARQASTTLPISINLAANIGKDVRFEGLGLSTNLAGRIDIRSLPTKTLIGNGVLELKNGRYEGYGQKLAIQHGQLLFAGPLDGPALDIQATRTVGDVTAGLELTGTVQSPQSRLFSSPAMSNAEIMSYLVTGKPLGAASTGADTQALTAAAASLGANNPIAQELSQKLGIDLAVQSGTTSLGTEVKVGKQLSPRLRIGYIYGLFNKSAAFQVIYKLTKHLSLTGQSGDQQSVDLKYNIER